MRASIHLRPKETGKNKTAIAVVTRLSTTRKPKEKIRRKKKKKKNYKAKGASVLQLGIGILGECS